MELFILASAVLSETELTSTYTHTHARTPQMVFAEDLLYESEAWKALTSQREKFMSEKVILQYLGFVGTHMAVIESGKHAGTPRERKVFYQVTLHHLASPLAFSELAAGQPLTNFPVEWPPKI